MGAAYANDRSRMYTALVVLLMALAVLVIKDRDFWFGNAETPIADAAEPEWVPGSIVQPPAAAPAPAAQVKKHVVTKTGTEPAIADQPVVAISRATVPPLEVEVIAGDTRGAVHGSSPVKIETSDSESGAPSTTAERGPATVASERVRMSVATAETQPQPREVSYPLLGRQMKVQGSVLLQALIGADGIIQDLRVLSGPSILASAAREAARRWQFKPYLQNGKPVETQANITVNFTIKVLDNGVRDQTDTVVALSRGGE
jgi:periplasmic protein TonB